jgi:hypothetical protein
VSNVILIKGKSALFTNVLATMRKTSTACIGNLVSANGALVAGDIDNLNNIGIFFVSAHRHLDSLAKDRSFFINTATHCRLFAGYDHLRNIHNVFRKGIIPREASNLTEHFIF